MEKVRSEGEARMRTHQTEMQFHAMHWRKPLLSPKEKYMHALHAKRGSLGCFTQNGVILRQLHSDLTTTYGGRISCGQGNRGRCLLESR